MKTTRYFLASLAILAASTAAAHAAGVWGTWTEISSDATSSITSGNYTTAINVGGSSVTINGVLFTAGASSGSNYAFDGDWQGASADSLAGVTGNVATLLNDSVRPSHFFGFYNSDLTLSGLTSGTAYKATFFFPGTTAGGGGDGAIGVGSDTTTIPSPANSSKGYYLTYSYTATGSSINMTLPAGGSDNVRLAGFLNMEDAPVPPIITNPTWNAAGSGDWNNASNWSGGIPNGVGATAVMGSATTDPSLVYTTTGETVGNLVFDSSNSYTLAGAYPNGKLTLTSTATALIDVRQGTHVLNLPTTFGSNTTISVSGGSTFRISDPINLNGKTVTKTGSGTLALDVNFQTTGGVLATSAGVLEVGSQAVITPTAMSFGGSSVLQGNGVIDGANFDYESSSASTFSGSIRGAGKHLLLDADTGSLVLSGSNTYTGGTSVLSGTLIIAGQHALPDGALTIGAGGKLIFDHDASMLPPLPASAAGNVSPVPEPGTLGLLAAGLGCGLLAWRRKHVKSPSV